MLEQTWEAFTSIVPYRGTVADTPMRPPDLAAEDLLVLTLEYNFGKGINKELSIPQVFLGRIDKEALAESPNIVGWLDLHCRELLGIGLLELQREKRADTLEWNRMKSCYMFPGERRSQTYTGELGNKHLREVALFCGLGPRIVSMIVMHSSCRGGGAQESELNASKGKFSWSANAFSTWY